MSEPLLTLPESSSPEARLAATAAAVADTSRARMLCALMDGRAYTATELSVIAEVAASTASVHLARLVDARFVSVLSQGRHRYYRLASSDIADILERLMGVSWHESATPAVKTPLALRHARTCYDHLAGEVAVALYDAMRRHGWISEEGERLTPQGEAALSALGVDCQPPVGRRRFCSPCLDWSERRYHLGGALGAALLAAFIRKGWLLRALDSREVSITLAGKRALNQHFFLIK